jgi:hypothetical protein
MNQNNLISILLQDFDSKENIIFSYHVKNIINYYEISKILMRITFLNSLKIILLILMKN